MQTTKRSRHELAVQKLALGYPGAVEEFPWGHSAVKVKGKAFLFMGSGDGEFSLSVKLPHTAEMALSLPFAEPTGYGLGKSGWVSASFKLKEALPIDLLREWLDESYRAIAPKKLIAELDGGAAAPKVKVKAKPKATPKKKPAAKPKKKPRAT